MTTISEPLPATERLVRGQTPWLRLAALTVLLIALNVAVTNGLVQACLWLGQPQWAWGPAGRFAHGWLAFLPVLLALWLTWGGGAIAWRMLLVLLTTAAGIAIPRFFDNDPTSAYQEFIGSLLMFCVAIFTIHLLLMPLRGYLGWEFWFAPTSANTSPPRAMRWSLLHIVGWTAFAAFPLAFARLLATWCENWWGQPAGWDFWFSLIINFALPLLAAGAVMVAIFFTHIRLAVRLGVLPVTFGFVFILLSTLGPLIWGTTPRLSNEFAIASGMMASALVNLSLIRLFGVRLHRPK